MKDNMTENEIVRRAEFLSKVKVLCGEYKLAIEHEDGHGGFLIKDSEDFEWLMHADYGKYEKHIREGN